MSFLNKLFGPPDVDDLKKTGDIPGLIRALSRQKDSAARRRAIDALGQLGDARAVQPLIALLSDKDVAWDSRNALERLGAHAVEPLLGVVGSGDRQVREAAITVLAHIGDARAVHVLCAALGEQGLVYSYTVIEALARIGAPAVEPLCVALKTRDLFKNAVQALVRIGDKRAVEPLCTALADSDPEVRCTAAEAMIMLGDARAVEPLCTALADGSDRLRLAALRALAQIGDKRAVGPVCACLDDASMDVRLAAAEALVSLGDANAVVPLCVALETGDKAVRRTAAQVLGHIGDARAANTLRTALSDRDCSVRLAAAQALAADDLPPDPVFRAWYWTAAQAWDRVRECGEAAREPLLAALSDGDAGARAAAARTLGDRGDPCAVDPLVARLKDRDQDVRAAAARALKAIGIPSVPSVQAWYAIASQEWTLVAELGTDAIDPLVPLLKDKELSQGAIKAFAALGTPAVESLIAVLQNGPKTARVSAAQALAEIGDARAVQPLGLALQTGDADLRKCAVQALGQIGVGDQAIEPLRTVLHDGDADLCKCALQALGQIGGTAVVPLLVEAVRGGEWFVPEEAVSAAAHVGAPAVEPLIESLRDIETKVRRFAARALGEIGDARATPALIDALKDSQEEVAEAAALSLGKIGDSRAVDALLASLWDRRWNARKACVTSLGELRDPRAVRPLLAMVQVQKKGDSIHAAAVDALVKLDDLALPIVYMGTRVPGRGYRELREAASEVLEAIQARQAR